MRLDGKKITRSTLSVAMVLVFVKFVGIIKQAIIAAYFGANGEMDCFLVASEFVAQTGTLIFSALSLSFLTLYVDSATKKEIKTTNQFVSNTFWTFLPFASGIALIFFLCADIFAVVLVPGYDAAGRMVVADYIRIVSVVIVNACITNICIGVLEGAKHFVPAKLCGILQSACLIVACVFFSDRWGVRALLVAFIIYFIIENLYLLMLVRYFTGFRLTKRMKDSRMVQLLKLSVPLFISNGIVEINNIGDKAIASMLSEGNISALSYGNYLFNSTHAIIIGSICSVYFSYFSTCIAKNDVDAMRGLLVLGIKRMILILLPVVAVIGLYAEDIISIIYARGKFDYEAIMMTKAALLGYSIGILFVGIRDMLMRAHYALKDTKRPMINALLGGVLNLGMSIIFAIFLNMGVFGISLGSTVSYMVIAAISYFTLRKHLTDIPLFEDKGFYLKLLMGLICCLTAGVSLNTVADGANIFVAFFLKAGLVCIIYFAVLLVLKCEECLLIWRYIKGRFGGK